MAVQKKIKFQTVLTRPDPEWGWYFLVVEREIESRLGFPKGSRRVICTINGKETFPCALMPWGEIFYIMVNKARRESLGIDIGSKVTVELQKDESKYGMPMPEELEEVLKQDPDGDKLFHALTPGKQRNIIYYVSKVKDIDRRIHCALIFVEHLKKNEGKIDNKALAEELKRPVF